MIRACQGGNMSWGNFSPFPSRLYRFMRRYIRGVLVKLLLHVLMFHGGERKSITRIRGMGHGSLTGRALMNQSIHAIDILCYPMGQVETVAAFSSKLGHENVESEDTSVAAR